MTASGSTGQILPRRAWRSFSGAFTRAIDGIGVMLIAGRSFVVDIASPASGQEQLMAEHARTFRFATRFLPDHYRDATIRLYAFFRSLDDLVDESPQDRQSLDLVRKELDGWRMWFDGNCAGHAPRYDLGSALIPVIRNNQIPLHLFRDFLDGLSADLDPVTPVSRADVETYSYHVASTVGISMAHVFGSTSPSAIEAAHRLGIAMQLTNILRDVGGDAARNRVYLPVSLLNEHGLSVDDVFVQWRRGRGPDDQLVSVLRTMASWADEHYAAGIGGVRLLPRDVQMPILVAGRLYQQILNQLESNDYDSLRQRAATSRWQKMNEARKCIFSLQHCLDTARAESVSGSSHRLRDRHPSESGTHAR